MHCVCHCRASACIVYAIVVLLHALCMPLWCFCMHCVCHCGASACTVYAIVVLLHALQMPLWGIATCHYVQQ